MEKTMELTELVARMARALVDEPDEVQVDEVVGASTVIIELTVAKADVGKVIGKQGCTVEALRTLLSAAAMKARKRSLLEIIEPEP